MMLKQITILFLFLLLAGCSALNKSADDLTVTPLNGDIMIVGAPFGGNGTIASLDGSTIELNSDISTTPGAAAIVNNQVYVLHSGSDSLLIMDEDNLDNKTEISVGNSPGDMAFFVDTKLFISNQNTHDISVLDFAADEPLVATIALPSGDDLFPTDPGTPTVAFPQGVAKANNKIYVSLANLAGFVPGGPGLISVINPTTHTIESTFELAHTNPGDMLVDDASNVLFVIQTGPYGDSLTTIEAINTLTNTSIATVVVSADTSTFEMDSSGIIYVTKSGMTIGRYQWTGSAFTELADITFVSSDPFIYLADILVSSDGTLYVADLSNDKVYIQDVVGAQSVVVVNDSPQILVEL